MQQLVSTRQRNWALTNRYCFNYNNLYAIQKQSIHIKYM